MNQTWLEIIIVLEAVVNAGLCVSQILSTRVHTLTYKLLQLHNQRIAQLEGVIYDPAGSSKNAPE